MLFVTQVIFSTENEKIKNNLLLFEHNSKHAQKDPLSRSAICVVVYEIKSNDPTVRLKKMEK